MKPTADFVRSIFDYDPVSGDLRWRKQLSYRGKLGTLAGSVQPRGKRRYRRVSFGGFRHYVHDVSGARGICWKKRDGKWLVRVAGRFVGYFVTLDEAIAARDVAGNEMFPGFHRAGPGAGNLAERLRGLLGK
jgi:hypothetical protein